MSCHENVNIYKPMLMTIRKVIPETPDVRTFQLAFADGFTKFRQVFEVA